MFEQTIDTVDAMELCDLEYLVLGDLGYFHFEEHGIVLLEKLASRDLTFFTCMYRYWSTRLS